MQGSNLRKRLLSYTSYSLRMTAVWNWPLPRIIHLPGVLITETHWRRGGPAVPHHEPHLPGPGLLLLLLPHVRAQHRQPVRADLHRRPHLHPMDAKRHPGQQVAAGPPDHQQQHWLPGEWLGMRVEGRKGGWLATAGHTLTMMPMLGAWLLSQPSADGQKAHGSLLRKTAAYLRSSFCEPMN